MVVLNIDFAPIDGLIGEFLRLWIDITYFSEALDVSIFDLLLIISEHGSSVPIVVLFEKVLIILHFSAILSGNKN